MSQLPSTNKLIVQKFGGATLATPEKIKAAAENIASLRAKGNKLVVVVSAMGKTTNELIQLAHKIHPSPPRRELDMLLSSGERISMSLMSIALNQLGCQAISFTGSQTGILTDQSHQNAFIKEVRPTRVVECLEQGQVVVVAGFQGVSPRSKEITTLGRGGTDTSAVALAAALGADRCEILKDVSAVFSADPNYVSSAKPISQLSYEQLLEMTYWGAKVMHYRSAELALRRKVKVYVGPAHSQADGTWIQETQPMPFESCQILSVNSHAKVIEVSSQHYDLSDALKGLNKYFRDFEIADPQILNMEHTPKKSFSAFITGPEEILLSIQFHAEKFANYTINSELFSSVTATCTGSSRDRVSTEIVDILKAYHIQPLRVWLSGMSTTVLVPQKDRERALTAIHSLVGHNYCDT